jgi:hypothetical protein
MKENFMPDSGNYTYQLATVLTLYYGYRILIGSFDRDLLNLLYIYLFGRKKYVKLWSKSQCVNRV